MKKPKKSVSGYARESNCDDLVAAQAWLRLIREQRWTERQKYRLLAKLGDPKNIYQCADSIIERYLCESNDARVRKPDSKQNRNIDDSLRKDLDWLSQDGNHLITIQDKRYPGLLKEIPDPPLALFARGNLACLADPKIAIVGSRRPTPVGSKIAESLAYDLAGLGLVITSGMALGVDGLAHQGALKAKTPTVAVMGCGLDIVYPSGHRALFQQIVAEGCVLSEYPLGVAPNQYRFPRRNRIVSGLSYGVVIVEAAARSGTLITARLATEQDREVMVVPGSVLSAQYQGSHALIQQGAALITEAADVLQLLSLVLERILQHTGNASSQKSSPEQQTQIRSPLLKHLSDQPINADQIILASGLTASEVSSMLLTLEVDGVIAMADGGGYVRLA